MSTAIDQSRGEADAVAVARPRPAWGAFVAVALASIAILVVMCRRVFLFWDDYLFLGQARQSALTFEYLGEPLFTHFSPVVRLVNWLTVPHIGSYPWLVPATLLTLLAGVVLSAMWLLLALFGRSWSALIGCIVLGPSLALLPLGNWWTAGVNFMPAIIGCQVSFAAMVLIVRGRSLLWSVPCLLGIVIGVLDYELAMLMPGYLGLWLLLFRARVTADSLPVVIRRTWWLWLGLIAVMVASLLNYRINYYSEVTPPTVSDGITAMAISLFRTLVPTAIGFHDPNTGWFATLGMVVGGVVMAALVAFTVVRRRGAWRGWLFAFVGWMLPTLLLVLNRAGIYGVGVGDNALYFYFPTMLFVIGALEAVWAPPRHLPSQAPTVGDPAVSSAEVSRGRTADGVDGRRVAMIVTAVAALAVSATAYVRSAPPTAAYQLPYGASGAYVEQVRASAAALRATLGNFTVIDSDVPNRIIPQEFGPWYNRASNVLGIADPDLRFDHPDGPFFVLDDSGNLLPAEIDWVSELDLDPGSAAGRLSITGVQDLRYEPGRGACFVAESQSVVAVQLPEIVNGDDLVVRTLVSVDAVTGERMEIVPTPGAEPELANSDGHQWFPDEPGQLDTVEQSSVSSVLIRGMSPGVAVCLSSIAVGSVRS